MPIKMSTMMHRLVLLALLLSKASAFAPRLHNVHRKIASTTQFPSSPLVVVKPSTTRLNVRFFPQQDDDGDENATSSDSSSFTENIAERLSFLPSLVGAREETSGTTASKQAAATTPKRQSLMNGIPPSLSSMLMPFAVMLDEATDGWALTYADLTPETESTPLGVAFLATNMAYTIVGLLLSLNGDVLLGTLTELASVASFAYHFGQLNLGPDQPPVRVALMLDYIVAGCTCLTGLLYVLTSDPSLFTTDAVVCLFLSVLFLNLSWVWEKGWPYILNHGLWHLFGAYAGYQIGQVHMMNHIG
jgi:hypothetical protein